MEELRNLIIEYINNNKLTDEECAEKLDLSIEDFQKILTDETYSLPKKDIKKLTDKINGSYISKGKRIVKSLDLIFRFVAMIMALVTLLLCINENVDTKVLVVLLSIGLVCSSMTILPKIEK